nr:MAG TPA: hypothetical protein [Caudoviricetes sp.]
MLRSCNHYTNLRSLCRANKLLNFMTILTIWYCDYRNS